MNRTFFPFIITAMTASSMSLRQVYWSDSAKLLVASDTIAACRDRRQEIRRFLTSLAKILRSLYFVIVSVKHVVKSTRSFPDGDHRFPGPHLRGQHAETALAQCAEL